MCSDVVEDMRAYYAQRAACYERVYHKPERQADLRAMEAWLPSRFGDRRVLEVACGTGWWTPHGARDCTHWLATDINAATMAVAQRKPLPAGKVEFAVVDAYTFDGLESQRFEAGARVVMLDNRYVQASNLPITRRDSEGNSYQRRTLDDASVHEVLKNFPDRDEAFAVIGARATDREWIAFDHYWLLSYRLA